MSKNTAVLLIGFGGPTSLAEVRPFLASVLKGVKVPPERIEEVAHHYEAFDGLSPYNEITFCQQKALQAELDARGAALPVLVGFRHAEPSFKEVFLELKKRNIKKVIGFILSSFRTHVSLEKYQEKMLEAREESGCTDIEVLYTGPFHSNPLFIEAQSNKVNQVIRQIPAFERRGTFLLFSAHSVPVPMSDQSDYAGQFLETAGLVAEHLGVSSWMAAYQSRSGDPKDPWLAPDVKEIIRAIDTGEFKHVVLVPAGFLCDNVEVLYDLDTEAKEAAEKKGLRYHRASTVTDEPQFIRMVADFVVHQKTQQTPRNDN